LMFSSCSLLYKLRLKPYDAKTEIKRVTMFLNKITDKFLWKC